jgi:uncharacterized protein with HEPN domain
MIMIHAQEIWDIIQTRLPRGCWVALEEIYEVVKKYGSLDAEDFEWQSPTSDIPKWKRNVRNVLQRRKGTKEILWDRPAKYMLS